MELATFSNLTKCTVVGLALAVGVSGCTTYKEAAQPYVEQYASAGCKEKVERNPTECDRLRRELGRIKDQYGSKGGGGTGRSTGFVYLMNP